MPSLIEMIERLWLKAGPILNIDMRDEPRRLKGGSAMRRIRALLEALRRRTPPLRAPRWKTTSRPPPRISRKRASSAPEINLDGRRKMDLQIKGLRVLVTAGANGIGRATARAFAAEGAKVHICDVDHAALAEMAKSDPG